MSTASPTSTTLPSPAVDAEALRRRGYVVVKALFGPEEVARLRTIARETMHESEREGRVGLDRGREGTIRSRAGDLLSTPSLREVLLDPRVLGVFRTLLGGDPVYFGDSSFRIGKNGVRGWHRDNVDRRRWRGGLDWSDPYPLLRGGLYLQDQSHHSGGLAVRPGSHRLGRIRPTLGRLVAAGAGDFVVWTLRTVHSGEAVRPRGLPGLALHPRLQSLLPSSLRLPEEQERTVLFMTFALEGPHLDRYLAYLKSRDYMRAAWAASRFGPEAWEQARHAGLKVLQAVPEYGAQPDEGDGA